jgi:hypothetical protein
MGLLPLLTGHEPAADLDTGDGSSFPDTGNGSVCVVTFPARTTAFSFFFFTKSKFLAGNVQDTSRLTDKKSLYAHTPKISLIGKALPTENQADILFIGIKYRLIVGVFVECGFLGKHCPREELC